MLLTFTITGDWSLESQNRIRTFWNRVRMTWLDTRYFWWAEFTRAGQLHYQAWWINPPHFKRVHLKSWIQRAWGSDFVDVSWPRDMANARYIQDYVLKYVWKMGKKSYQQRYAALGREFRTFGCNRLEIPPAELEHTIEKDIWDYEPGIKLGPRSVAPQLVCRGHQTHVIPIGGYCIAILKRRPRRKPRRRWDRPPSADELRSKHGRGISRVAAPRPAALQK